jgi:hypothetical protein
MRLFPDSPRRYYQDVLRTIGRFAEDHKFAELRIIETEDGIILQGRAESHSAKNTAWTTETYFFSVEDLLGMMREAYRSRGSLKDITGEG